MMEEIMLTGGSRGDVTTAALLLVEVAGRGSRKDDDRGRKVWRRTTTRSGSISGSGLLIPWFLL